MGNDQSEKLAGKLAFSHQTLSKMLGEASGRALDACWAEAAEACLKESKSRARE